MTNQSVTIENPTEIPGSAEPLSHPAASVEADATTADEIVPTPYGPGLRRKAAGRFLRRHYGVGSKAFLAKAAMDGSGPRFLKPSKTDTIYPITFLHDFGKAKVGEARTSFGNNAA